MLENKLPPGVVYRPVIDMEVGTYPNVTRKFLPRPCMQCSNPRCVPVCPVYLKDVCLTDPIAGDSVFNGVNVKLVLVTKAPRAGFPRFSIPRTGYMNEGPRSNLAKPDDADHAAWAAEAALEVTRGQRRAEDLLAEVARRLGRKP